MPACPPAPHSRPLAVLALPFSFLFLFILFAVVQWRSHCAKHLVQNDDPPDQNFSLPEQAASTNPLQEEPEHKTPFRPQLPWYSPTTSASAFPPRATLRRKKRTASPIVQTNSTGQIAGHQTVGRLKWIASRPQGEPQHGKHCNAVTLLWTS